MDAENKTEKEVTDKNLQDAPRNNINIVVNHS